MFTIYVALNEAGDVALVGRTRRFDRRAEELAPFDLRLEKVVVIDDLEKARVVEQFVLDRVRDGRSWHLEDLRSGQ